MTTKPSSRQKVEAGLKRRRRKELVFRGIGMFATGIGLAFLLIFFATLLINGSSAFEQTLVKLEIEFSADALAQISTQLSGRHCGNIFQTSVVAANVANCIVY